MLVYVNWLFRCFVVLFAMFSITYVCLCLAVLQRVCMLLGITGYFV